MTGGKIASHLPELHRKWFQACALGTAGFLCLHALYWLPPFPLPMWVTTLAGFVIFTELYFFLLFAVIGAVLLAGLTMGLGLLSLIVPRVRPWCGYWFTSRSGRRKWAFSPWLHSAGWTVLFFGHLGLDVDPDLTLICLSGAVLLRPEFWSTMRRLWNPLGGRWAILVWSFVAWLWWILADNSAVVVAAIVWAILLLLVARWPGRVLSLRDRFLLALLCIPPVQLFAAILPLPFTLHDGRELGDGMAYSFCEAKAEHRLFAAVPGCSPNQPEKCRERGRVDEFDARTLELRAQHRFFSSSFTGRLEQIACLEDRVQVGMDFTIVDGQELVQNLLEFRLDDPGDFTPNALGDASGDGIAYDRRRGVVYYRSDKDRLIRRDLKTGEIDRQVGAALAGLPPVTDIMVHERRDSLFLLSFYGSVLELDLKTLERRARYPILSGWEFTIDEELDRLYVAGTWGLEVVDLRSGEIVHRARAGLGVRRPAIDRRNDLLYVPSTAAGRLQVFDRPRLELLGTIPLGVGVRFPFVSEHGYVLSTSESGYYSWKADDLARRMRGEATGR